MSTKNYTSIPEAHESNAGDDFHVLWAAKKSLELLNFERDGLKKLTIEGPAESTIDSTGRSLLSIDLGEYYGGEDFGEATEVVFSQLKYSTRNDSLNYTLGRLCKGKKAGHAGSIINRFGDTFKTYWCEYGREAVLSKLKIKLVSNRPIQDEFYQNICSIQKLLKQSEQVSKEQLVAAFPNCNTVIEKLYSASGLSPDQFSDFLSVLDFNDCGTESRFYQKQHVIRSVSELGRTKARYDYNTLYNLVNERMMPENKVNNSLTIDDIVLTFEVGKVENLFPVPSKIEKLESRVEREHTLKIASEIVQSTSQIICLHGGAGVGKSTLVSNLKEVLPEESVSIIYDCYGQGTYLNSDEARHLPQLAFQQIANDIARELGTSLLLQRDLATYLYPRELKDRLRAAINLLAKSYENPLLTIFIDAADNSVTAAESKSDDCFIYELANIGQLPQGCKLIFTSRTGRVDTLKLPDNILPIEIKPFSLEESGKHLKQTFPNATVRDIEEFHDLTRGVPRVQKYTLQNQANLKAVFTFLKPYGHSVGTLIDGHIDEAKRKVGSAQIVDKILLSLIALPRPIPLRYAAEVAGVSEQEMVDFCTDLWTGLIIDQETIAFRDEDFETHLRDRYPTSTETYQQLAKTFLGRAEQDSYAAYHLGSILYQSRGYKELQDIVLGKQYIQSLKDPLVRREAFYERAKLALLSCSIDEDHLTYIKLLTIVAEETKSNKVILDTISNNADLVVENSGPSTIEKIYFDITKNIQYGASNWRCAAVLSRTDSYELYAEKHLAQAEKWLEKRQVLPEHERENYQIDEFDIASGGEAILRIKGVEHAARWLNRWRPKEMMFSVISSLTRKAVAKSTNKQIREWTEKIYRSDVQLAIAVELIEANKEISFDISELLYQWQRLLERKLTITSELRAALVLLCEHAISNFGISDIILSLLKYLQLDFPDRNVYFHSYRYGGDTSIQLLDTAFRIRFLIAVHSGEEISEEKLHPEKLLQSLKEDKHRSSESSKSQLDKLYKHLIPVYKFRTNVIARKETKDIAQKALVVVNAVIKDWSFGYERNDFGRIVNHCVNRVADLCSYTNNPEKLLGSLESIDKHQKVSELQHYVTLSNHAARYPACYPLVYLLLHNIDQLIGEGTRKALDKVEYYEHCVKIAYAVHDLDEAKEYFDKAVEAASEVDLEAYDQIFALSQVANKLDNTSSEPELAYELARFAEYSSNCLSGHDNFPWYNALLGIESLDYTSSLAVWCRWNHQNLEIDSDSDYRFWSDRIITALSRDHITVEQAISLSTFHQLDYKWPDLIRSILQKIEQRGNTNLRSKFLQDIYRALTTQCDIERRKDYAEKIIEILQQTKCTGNEVFKKIEQLYEFLVRIGKASDDFTRTKHEEKDPTENTAFDKYQDIDPIDLMQINEFLRSRNIENEYNRFSELDGFFLVLMQKCSPQKYTKHLDVLLQIDEAHISYNTFESTLENCLSAWQHKQTVTQWKKNSFRKVVEKCLLWFGSKDDMFEHIYFDSLFKIADLFNEDKKSLAVVLKRILPQIIEKFPVKSIYQSFCVFNSLLETDQAKEYLGWFLQRSNNSLPIEVAEGHWNERLTPRKEVALSFAQFLRYYLGHPVKAERWRAVHTVRSLANYGDTTILDYLFENRNSQSCMPFQHGKHIYFWISAKLWLFIAFDRIADESPEILLPFFEEMKNEAEQRENGHLLIRTMAKSICIKLAKFEPNLLSAEERKAFDNLLISSSSAVRYEYPKENSHHQGPDYRFKFDTLDTFNYWYDHLGRHFNLSKYEIASKADRVIADILRFTEDPDERNHMKHVDYFQRSTNHGDIPSVEDVRTYHEYHALFVVANQLLETMPLAVEGLFEWDEWFSRWLLTWDSEWLADLRDPTPLQKRYWLEKKRDMKTWKWDISSEYFDEVLGLTDSYKGETVTLVNYHKIHISKDSETVNITSALVNSDRASSLLSTLQTTSGFRIDYLPAEEDEDTIIDEIGFLLYPTIRCEDSGDRGLDKDDHRALSLMKIKARPSSQIIQGLNLEGSSDGRYFWVSGHKDSIVITFRNWSDFDENQKYLRGFGTNGYQLEISTDYLLPFLKEKNLCLIIKCRISRYVDDNSYDHNYYPGYTKYYLLHPDGTIKTTAGDYQLR